MTNDPLVRKLLKAAKQRLTSAGILLANDQFLDSTYLAGYGVECALKALLIARTPPRKRKSVEQQIFRGKSGHDFENLKAQLQKCQVNFGHHYKKSPDRCHLVHRPSIRVGLRKFGRRRGLCQGGGDDLELGGGTAMNMVQTDETKQIEDALRKAFPDVHAYRYNSASIRVRVIDERFRDKTKAERERMVDPVVATLPEDTLSDITVLLLLAPQETATSLMNLEFERPSPSRL